jgi:hypothetical protein
MASENLVNTLTGVSAGADLSTHQFKAMKVTAADTVGVATSLGERVEGVLQNKPSANGQAATVAVAPSMTKMVASAAIVAGAFVTTAADGRAVTAGAGHNVLGTALTAATAANQLVTVQLGNKGNV